MKKLLCPQCGNDKVATERRPNGNSSCIPCKYTAPTQMFYVDDNPTEKYEEELWATQLLGSEDGNYIMSVDKAFVERMSNVEIAFKVVRAGEFDAVKAENTNYKKHLQLFEESIRLPFKQREDKHLDEIRRLKEENEELQRFSDRQSAQYHATRSKLVKMIEDLNKIKERFIKPDAEFEADGCECVVCGSSVHVDDNDWENGTDACWECKAYAYDDIVIAVEAITEIGEL